VRIVCDIECNGLVAPDKIWLIVCKDIDSGVLNIFRNPTTNPLEKERFLDYSRTVTTWVGHNFLGYDGPQLVRLLGFDDTDLAHRCVDTLVVSKLVDYSRPQGHSVEDYGLEFGFEKLSFSKFTDTELEDEHSSLFKQLEAYCIRDCDITERIYRSFDWCYSSVPQSNAINLEQSFQLVVNSMHANGFGFDTDRARRLLEKVTEQLKVLDDEILKAFPPRSKFLKEYTPKLTKHGTISKSSVPRGVTDLTAFTEGCSFSTFTWEEFNPASHKQIIKVLNEAGWQPEEKTQSHIDTERELNRLKYQKNRSEAVDLRIQLLHTKIIELQKTGWKVNETNLDTLPKTAPPAARLLAKRILLESRRRTLTEWLSLVSEDNRIRGRFYGIGAWTHRMAHQKPNTANIPNDVYVGTGKTRLLGKELRQLWRAPKNRLLAGVDAESIQFRIFAHLINDKELIEAITNGKKSDKTDPHSYNQRIFGPHCKTRNASKHSMFAIFFGGRANKISQIMACTKPQAEEAIERLLQRYPGLARLEKEVFPEDARRGYFIGLDGRRVKIPGDTVSQRKHLCMSGYLQNGEAVIMKSATIKWENKLKDYDSILVDLVHDEWQTETPNNQETAVQVAKMQADSLYEVGLDLELNCPLAGSYWNDDKKDYTIGTNWYQTH